MRYVLRSYKIRSPSPYLRTSRQKGDWAETRAAHFLQRKGLQLLARNFYCKQGEIDLIFFEKKSATLIFVEVRSRNNTELEDILASIDKDKQKKIIHAARYYLHTHFFPSHCRHPPSCTTGSHRKKHTTLVNSVHTYPTMACLGVNNIPLPPPYSPIRTKPGHSHNTEITCRFDVIAMPTHEHEIGQWRFLPLCFKKTPCLWIKNAWEVPD